MISFIVPAHNEQASLGRTLEVIHKTARAVGQPYEVIVVDDASTDATPEIAAQNNARVVSVNHRQIAATRGIPARAPRKAKGSNPGNLAAATPGNRRITPDTKYWYSNVGATFFARAVACNRGWGGIAAWKTRGTLKALIRTFSPKRTS